MKVILQPAFYAQMVDYFRLQLTWQKIMETLGGLPADKQHTAALAVETLHTALKATRI